MLMTNGNCQDMLFGMDIGLDALVANQCTAALPPPSASPSTHTRRYLSILMMSAMTHSSPMNSGLLGSLRRSWRCLPRGPARSTSATRPKVNRLGVSRYLGGHRQGEGT